MSGDNSNLFGESVSDPSRAAGLNSYLQVAYKAILVENRPLHSFEILSTAKDFGFLPDHLTGETPHKTLNARLSEHILSEGDEALFFRTAPATYFICDLAEQISSEAQYSVYRGIRRSKRIKSEKILVIDKGTLQESIYGTFVPFVENTFTELFGRNCYFKDRKSAEMDSTIKQFVTFTVVFHKSKLLIYRRGALTNVSDQLKGALSVGFGGHVNDSDFSLFDQGGAALIHNSSRELMEELYLLNTYKSIDDVSNRSKILGYINVDSSEDAKHHIAVIVAFNHRSDKAPTKGELSINELQWIDPLNLDSNIESFDLWSRLILEHIKMRIIDLNGN